jgi:cysteine-S-conjugate beta-lyase
VSDSQHPETKLISGGRKPEWTLGVVNPPVFHASTCVFETLDAFDAAVRDPDAGLYYGRRGTPTTWALEEALTALEPGAAGTCLTPSGVAAISVALLSAVKPGDHILVSDNVYEPTRKFCDGLLAQNGITTTYFPPMVGDDFATYFAPNTRAVFLETPGSLTFEVQDVPRLSAVARAHNALTILDNTWATSLYYSALKHGADISIQSLTKYVIGHSDAMMGALTATEKAWGQMRKTYLALGQCAAPDDAFLALRGLRTLAVRLKQHDISARKIADWLATHPAVEKIYHPARADCTGHDIWTRDFSGASGLFGMQLKPAPRANLAAFVDGMAHFKMGFSWGGFESLILVTNVAQNRTAEPWKSEGPLLRLHIGLEHIDDLIADLDAGLKRYQA